VKHIHDVFVYAIRLANGALSQARVTIDIEGVNDAATISGDNTGAAVEAGGVGNAIAGTPTDSGDLDVADLDAGEAVFQAVAPASLTGTYGDFTFDETTGEWTYTLDNDRAATQALNVGDAASDSLVVTSLDGTDTETITVNITGANDAAVITGTASDSVTEASGVLNGTPGDATGAGDLDATDVDNSAAFVVQTDVASTYGTFSIDATGAWSYTLDDDNTFVQGLNTGGTLHDLITVATADGTEQVIDVTINGANDAAVITGTASDSVTEATSGNPGTPTATGNLLATDVDNANDVFQIVAPGGTTTNSYGTYAVTAAGVWTYTLDNTNATVNALNNGGILTDSFTVNSQDGTAQVVNITINGATDNQAPTDLTLSNNTIQETSLNNTVVGTLSTTDPDNVSGFSYTLIDNAGGRFKVDVSTGVVSLARTDLIDFEFDSTPTHDIVVQVVDLGGATYSETFTINVTNFTNITTTNQADVIDGTSGIDVVNADNGEDRVYGGEGDDVLSGQNGADALYGQGGADTLNGDGAADIVLDGGDGNDILNGGGANDILIGGKGADTFNVSDGNDRMIWRAEDLGTGIDVVNNLTGGDILQIGDVLTGYSGGSSIGFVQVVGNVTNILVQVDPNGGGDSWTTLAQVTLAPTLANITTVTNALDLTTYTRTAEIG
jgi:VCBS repeat-containing protein